MMALLRAGATVPLIARYRKEKAGGLDDTQLRKLQARLGYLNELEERRATPSAPQCRKRWRLGPCRATATDR